VRKKESGRAVKWSSGLVMALLALAVLAGCSARINSVIINRDAGTRRWDIDNAFLSNDLKILDIKEEVKDGMLYVNVQVKNGWAMPIGGLMKVQFYGTNGVQLDDPWGWHEIMMEASQDEWFRFIAPRPEEEIGRMKIMVRGINRWASSGK
jgi:hypothetical protein